MALRIVTGHQHDAATECSGDPDVVIAVDRHTPRHVDCPAAGEALRRGLGAVGANHVHNAGGHFGIGQEGLHHVRGKDLELLHDGHAGGDLRLRKIRGHVARYPEVAFRVQGDAANADPAAEGFNLGRIVGGKPQDRVRLGVADPDTILIINCDAEGRLQPLDLDDAAVLHSAAGKIQQLIARAIGNPDVAVRGDTDAHQSEELLPKGEVAFLSDRLAVEIHHADFPVETRHPNFVERYPRAPTDAVHAHAGEAGDCRRERGPVGGELDCAATDALAMFRPPHLSSSVFREGAYCNSNTITTPQIVRSVLATAKQTVEPSVGTRLWAASWMTDSATVEARAPAQAPSKTPGCILKRYLPIMSATNIGTIVTITPATKRTTPASRRP